MSEDTTQHLFSQFILLATILGTLSLKSSFKQQSESIMFTKRSFPSHSTMPSSPSPVSLASKSRRRAHCIVMRLFLLALSITKGKKWVSHAAGGLSKSALECASLLVEDQSMAQRVDWLGSTVGTTGPNNFECYIHYA